MRPAECAQKIAGDGAMNETIALIKAAQSGDSQARERLVSENSGLIWSIIRKFIGRGTEAEDLFQIGCIGLLKCIDKFDLSYNVKFSTYAVPMIMGEIKRFLRDDGMIKVSRSLKEIAIKAKYAEAEFLQKKGTPPSVQELAEAVGVETGDLVMAMESALDIESLYQTVYQNEGNNQVYLIDRLVNEDNEEMMVDVIALKELISQLKPKERQIIMMRYFGDKTQTETAQAVGISQVQVSRLEKKALTEIREKFT